jgi:carbonic anhydrase
MPVAKIWDKINKTYIAIENISYIYNDIGSIVIVLKNSTQIEYSHKDYTLDFIHFD